MATNTYVALATQTLGSATNSVTFSSISSGYTDLRIVVANAKATNTARNVFIRVGDGSVDTGSNYSYTNLGARALSSTPFSARDTGQTSGRLSWYTAMTTAQAQMSIVDIMNYSNTTTFKTMLNSTRVQEGDATYSGVEDLVILWRSTSAINTISIFTDVADTFQAGTTFSLYGIAAASVGAKATGGIISSDDQYYYHTFTSTGTFTPLQSLTCDFLVVAGGGGGGSGGGAGGAGGYRTSVGTSGRNSSAESPLSVTATAYTITVGAGGAGGAAGSSAVGVIGSNSVFSTITSTGGGRGASSSSQNGGAGGSGGGTFSGASAAGTGTANQGFDNTAAFRSGGAGVGGTNSTYSGGAGLTSTLTGTALGGGGASSGDQSGQPTGTATAGGGAAATAYTTANAGDGSANTGGGGGSGGGQTGVAVAGAGGSGGSGIVVIRYAK